MADIHAGHRERLRERARAEGLKEFQAHEVLELLLMQIIPHRNVNPLAHALIERFGTLEGVLCAEKEEIAQVEGAGERTAQWLSCVGELALAFADCWPEQSVVIVKPEDALSYLSEMYAGRVEQFRLLCMNRAGHVLRDVWIPLRREGLPTARQLLEVAMENRAAQLIGAHRTDKADEQAEERLMEKMRRICDSVGILYMDHIIVRSEDAVSLRRKDWVYFPQMEDEEAAER